MSYSMTLRTQPQNIQTVFFFVSFMMMCMYFCMRVSTHIACRWSNKFSIFASLPYMPLCLTFLPIFVSVSFRNSFSSIRSAILFSNFYLNLRRFSKKSLSISYFWKNTSFSAIISIVFFVLFSIFSRMLKYLFSIIFIPNSLRSVHTGFTLTAILLKHISRFLCFAFRTDFDVHKSIISHNAVIS